MKLYTRRWMRWCIIWSLT